MRPASAARAPGPARRAGPRPGPVHPEIDLPRWTPGDVEAVRRTVAERTTPWDLVVVGAGITGAGIARDAALRGLSVLVIDAHDVAYGTSSRSTRLIHGGVRYLEQGDVGLVYEALRERQRLYEAAPHLVRPARFLFPAFAGDRLGPWKLRLGLTLYDALNLYRGSTHDFVPPDACRDLEPLLATEGLRGAVRYEDAITDDARLTLTVLQDARRHGAQVLSYARVVEIERRDDTHVALLDDGLRVAGRQAVVATGPWTGRALLGGAGDELLTLSKGIHVVMRAENVPVRQPIVIQAPRQRRILFVVPWGKRTYLGTTDSPYEGDPGLCGVTETDEHELLGVIAQVLPGADLRVDNIVSAWSGVRPLVRPDRAGSRSTVDVSRRHRVVERDDGVLGLVGGKLTTFRAMAEELVDRVVASRPGTARAQQRSTTHEVPLVPGTPITAHDRTDPLVADLEPRHGPFARELAAAARGTDGAEPLAAGLPYRWCEIDHALAYEGVRHLDDLLRRRLPLALTDPDLGGRVARPVARRLVDALGGGAADIEREVARYVDRVQTETRRIPRAPEGK
jgi:glycerol-3-phosphate dehydrogenase